MWKSSGHDYHAVLYLRPDILYNCPFPTAALDSLETGSVYIADFHHWHGYNDRFAMGRPDTVGLWGDRYGSMSGTCASSTCMHTISASYWDMVNTAMLAL